MKNTLISAVRGMRDILPEQIAKWQQLENIAAACFNLYGYQELRTPLVERLELFSRQLGEETDVVQKEMYRFTDHGDDVALRPEATVSVVRALLAGDMQRSGTVRVWYGGPMFRRERPQKGRHRQFHQLGAEALGHCDPALDAEQIIMLARLWRALGIGEQLCLQLNNLGDRDERSRYREALAQYLNQHKTKLDADARHRISSNPLRILDSKDPQTQAVVADAPRLAGALCDDSRQYMDTVKEKLTAAGVDFTDNPTLVRGLDYYNLTVYEWSRIDDTRRQNTVCGGGRYDGLAENIGGGRFPGCGFALGAERILDLMAPVSSIAADCFLAFTDNRSQTSENVDRIAELCRNDGITVWRHIGSVHLDRQLKKAHAMKIPLVIIIGSDECAGDYVTLKRLDAGTQQRVKPAEISTICKQLLKH